VTTQTLTAVIHREGEWYVAECPETGTASQGATMEEALANLREATELYLDETKTLLLYDRSIITTFEAAIAHA
jgi:predicted RNase H-like HicB family nuclease